MELLNALLLSVIIFIVLIIFLYAWCGRTFFGSFCFAVAFSFLLLVLCFPCNLLIGETTTWLIVAYAAIAFVAIIVIYFALAVYCLRDGRRKDD